MHIFNIVSNSLRTKWEGSNASSLSIESWMGCCYCLHLAKLFRFSFLVQMPCCSSPSCQHFTVELPISVCIPIEGWFALDSYVWTRYVWVQTLWWYVSAFHSGRADAKKQTSCTITKSTQPRTRSQIKVLPSRDPKWQRTLHTLLVRVHSAVEYGLGITNKPKPAWASFLYTYTVIQ
jgi:hypothetical protein